MMPVKQFRQLHRLIDEIYKEADRLGFTWTALADRAGLAESTVYNLGNWDTMFPRLQTVHLLAQAVGMELTLIAIKKLRRKAG